MLQLVKFTAGAVSIQVYTIDMVAESKHGKQLKQGFEPLVGKQPRLLILGTFPGDASLAAGEYYAHPRNSFWEMMDAVCGAGRRLAYGERCRVLTDAGIALWDILQSCRRIGSADSKIETAGMKVNRLPEFIAEHTPQAIACNGQQAARLFKRLVLPECTKACPPVMVLPSTSPANARMPLAQKRQHWQTLSTWLDE